MSQIDRNTSDSAQRQFLEGVSMWARQLVSTLGVISATREVFTASLESPPLICRDAVITIRVAVRPILPSDKDLIDVLAECGSIREIIASLADKTDKWFTP